MSLDPVCFTDDGSYTRKAELDKLYSPSYWSKRFNNTEICDNFMKLSQEHREKARSKFECELDISYGPGAREKYDIYGKNLPNDAPIFVFIHGGYWQELSKDESCFPVEPLVTKGIKVYTIGYSLCPSVTLSEIVAQVKRATDKILKDARDIGSKGVWIAGHSAGAHLAASLLHDEEWLATTKQNNCLQLIKGLLLIGGLYNLEQLLQTSYNDALKLNSEDLKNYSFGLSDTKQRKSINDIKVIVTVGECDTPIFIQQSKDYSQKLVDFVDNIEFILLRNSIDHYDIIENLADSNFILTKIIVEHSKV